MIECVCSFEEEYGFLKSETMNIISELIRCKDCVNYWQEYSLCAELTNDNVCRVHVGENDYCSKAERKMG